MAKNFRSVSSLSVTLASLASSASLIAGREVAEYDNSTNKDDGGHLSGRIITGTSPTGGSIIVYAFTRLDDTPTYPDVFGGTDAARTVTSANVLSGALKPLWSVGCDTTSNRTYDFDGIDVALAFGGVLPAYFSLFVTHSSGVALNTTGHFVKFKPYYFS